ncbi:MAG: hypothetical protein NTX31_08260 [Burkholderiales bacterium]|nr:hypothetical protein [Burkholderiales bacterium]
MGTTASLYPAVDAAAVWSRLPLRYRTSVGIAALGTDPIDLLVFETGERHVVTLEELMKSLSGIESPSMRLAVIGFDFTEEARIRIRSLGGRIFAEQNVWD